MGQDQKQVRAPVNLDDFLRNIAEQLRAGERPHEALLREGAEDVSYPITYYEDEDGQGEYALVHWVPADGWHVELEMDTWGAMQGFRFNLYEEDS
jgi:hypothetical protein